MSSFRSDINARLLILRAVSRSVLLCLGVALLANAPRHPPERTKKKKDEVSKRIGNDENTCC